MARRRDGKPPLPDWHLWTAVSETISPLRRTARRRRKLSEAIEAAPLPGLSPPPPPAPRPKKQPPVSTMPSYQPQVRPGGGNPANTIEPGIRQRLKRGQITIDGTIDLHGMRQSEAHVALRRFLVARASRGDRTVLVITGKGLKKLERDAAVIVERGVLRAMLPLWLSEADIAPLIAGWDSAAQGHGGEGAFYVRLRPVR